QKRLGLRKVIEIKVQEGVVADHDAARIKELIDSADTSFFYPLVYMLDLAKIPSSRRRIAGSGATTNSCEFFILDLSEAEFSLLFGHFREDRELRRFVLDVPHQQIFMESHQIFEFIENRRIMK